MELCAIGGRIWRARRNQAAEFHNGQQEAHTRTAHRMGNHTGPELGIAPDSKSPSRAAGAAKPAHQPHLLPRPARCGSACSCRREIGPDLGPIIAGKNAAHEIAMCAFIPKYHCWPLAVCCISGSLSSLFFVELGALMIAASTMVPFATSGLLRSGRRALSSCTLTELTKRSASSARRRAGPERDLYRRALRLSRSLGTAPAQPPVLRCNLLKVKMLVIAWSRQPDFFDRLSRDIATV